MATGRAKYKRVTDLYVQGTEHVLKDGNVMWLQVLNPFEADEARHDAQVARSRLTLAIKEHGGEELDKVRGQFVRYGAPAIIELLAEHVGTVAMYKAVDDLRNDPDWKERLEIADRSEEILALPQEDSERKLLNEINRAYLEELQVRANEARDSRRETLERLDLKDLKQEYTDYYLDERGQVVALAEHTVTEVWYAARVCEGVKNDEEWDHGACDHTVRVWDEKREVRILPEDLMEDLHNALLDLSMSVREAKNSDRQGSSSDSSPLPSEPRHRRPLPRPRPPKVSLVSRPSHQPSSDDLGLPGDVRRRSALKGHLAR
jgi:hypothetical protein